LAYEAELGNLLIMLNRRFVLAGILGVSLTAGLPFGAPAKAASAPEILTAPEALRKVAAGELILIDVRSEKEWRETGIPKGALAISIHDPRGKTGFLEKVRAAIGGTSDKPVATICAAGVRSDRTQIWLLEAGYQPVMNVREGMLGRWRPLEPAQPGWLKRGLPTEPWKGG
jgi:rhodanese-related sulfurtransferase